MIARILIADDEPLARDVIRLMLHERTDIDIVGECKNGRETVRAIRTQKPDLVFLDVQMPDLDGFGVIEKIGVEDMPVAIFVTAYDQYAIQAFEVNALDYLLKPFDQDRFDQAMERALKLIRQERSSEINQGLLDWLDSSKTGQKSQRATGLNAPKAYLKRLVIKESGRVFFVKIEEIDWIEAAGDYVSLHVGRKSHLLHESLGGLQARLDPERFLRIHRSTIVSTEYIRELQPHSNGEYFVFLKDGTRLKLSRNYRANLKAFLGEAI